ncbi:MAG: rhomboid family intramembrane serine protease [Acidobacteriota bacterium]
MIPLRDENPTRTTPWVNYLLVAINVVVFIYQMELSLQGGSQAYVGFVQSLALRADHLLSPSLWFQTAVPAPLTLFTAIFVHADLWHLLGNMLYLWIFGDNVEDAMGHIPYALFYLICGLGAALAQVAVSPGSATPMIGASGAIAGILGAYLVLHPGARVLTLVFLVFFVRIMYLPAIILLGIWFLMQLVSAASGGAGVAWYAHIGGFVVGILLVGGFVTRSRRGLYSA